MKIDARVFRFKGAGNRTRAERDVSVEHVLRHLHFLVYRVLQFRKHVAEDEIRWMVSFSEDRCFAFARNKAAPRMSAPVRRIL